MIAGSKVRELDWPTTDRFPNHGAVWPRRRLDAALIDAASEAGAEVVWDAEAMPVLDGDRVVGVEADGCQVEAAMTVVAAGAQGSVARLLGADRVADEPFGLAIRTYAATPRHADAHLEACLSLRDEHGTPIPGYGWMFPAGDGTVNIGVGALSTMKGFKKLNLNTLLEAYRRVVQDDVGSRPRSRTSPGVAAADVGEAPPRAGLGRHRRCRRTDQPDERRGHRLRTRIGNARRRPVPRRSGDGPGAATTGWSASASTASSAPAAGSRSSSATRGSCAPACACRSSTDAIAHITLAVMGNLVDNTTPGAAGKVLWLADKTLGLADPILRKTRATALTSARRPARRVPPSRKMPGSSR